MKRGELDLLREELQVARDQHDALQFRECIWTPDINGIWETQCDNMFEFTDDGPHDNGFKYCPYCGGKLIETEFVDEKIDEEEDL